MSAAVRDFKFVRIQTDSESIQTTMFGAKEMGQWVKCLCKHDNPSLDPHYPYKNKKKSTGHGSACL